MTPERWASIERIFAAALEYEVPEQRAAYLDLECPPDLREEVDAMLAADAGHDARVEQAISQAAEAMAAGSIPKRAGAYEIVGSLGRGGMGTVALGRRADGAYQQDVAIKFLRFDADSPLSRERFRLERQILADLDHPHIARLLDGGTTSEGQPYIVLEYVAGEPIDAWARSRALRPADCCRLLLKVCGAVSFAHSRLIVHRDLKPSNILVTANGAPKLLDFGVAKLLSPSAHRVTQTLTHAALTPEYASPEQVRGDPITTATDVYALGATLYALLAGCAPFKFQTTSPAELVEVICNTPVPPPSAIRPVPKDLDRIVLMAMQRDPELRYRGVEAFADDLARYLDGLPVRARGQSLWYRSSKLLRRHWFAVAASTAMLAALTGATVWSVRQAGIAEQARRAEARERAHAEAESSRALTLAAEAQRQRLAADASAREAKLQTQAAQRRFQQVRQLAGRFLFDFHDAVRNLAGSFEARRLVVRTALEYLDSLAADRPADPALQRELATAFERVGDAQGNPYFANIGDLQGALASYRKALTLRLAYPASTPGQVAERIMAHARIGDIHGTLGQRGEAENDYAAALAIATAAPPALAAQPAILDAQSKTLSRRGDLFAKTSRSALALADYEEALRKAEQWRTLEPASIAARDAVHSCQRKVARALYLTRKFAEAQRIMLPALEEAKQIALTDPANTSFRRNLLVSHWYIADNAYWLNDHELSLQHLLLAAQEAEHIARPSPGDQQAQLMWADLLGKAGTVAKDLGRFPEATDLCRRGVVILENLDRTQPFHMQTRSTLAAHRMQLGSNLVVAGQPEAGLPLIQDARILIEDLLRRDPTNRELMVFLIRNHQVTCLALEKMKRPAEALPAIRRALELLREFQVRDKENKFAEMVLPDATRQWAETARAAAQQDAATQQPGKAFWSEALQAFESIARMRKDRPEWLLKRLEEARQGVAAHP